jgi:endonuclease/exonuclease/phosphatase family metal-dependent hydrolase
MTFHIVTYNLLVPIYAEQTDYYIKCKPEFLKTAYRWNLIESQLEEEIVHHENTIICFQELSLSMLPKLELFFRRLKYSLFSNLYGGEWNDYMGVGIAIPLSMQLNDIFYIKIGEHIRSICKRREDITNLSTDESNLLASTSDEVKEVAFDPWETSINRSNTLICLKLVIDGKLLFIGTYHMPCYYREPSVMAIHSSVVKDLMFQLADGNDFIFAGDFNLQPRDTGYRALIEKGYCDVHYPKSTNYNISYQPNTEQVMKSAYREKNGSEPVYTNYSYTVDSPYYCETLDYIFFDGQITVEQVLELPNKPVGEAYPDETHPSDHLMLAATFRYHK